ncbi:hypothetical protein H6F42_20695 [Pseudanabaena sp. FACHB-1998]|uniref:hypothetical protein n=1 Tax=Pseudanabaena sp. FACHB-1998 TaxID=2692858 RepID=UPI0016802C35|nr:hypothetical protein [Pseudanabaena sp. FACHB-1998]MBD2179347.1 hypothetical protein [Pseudanabaena sp. FACHB-1998]
MKVVGLLVVFGVIAVTANEAFAVDLVNKDNGGYEVKISLSSGTNRTFIDSLSVKREICRGKCEIEVKGVGIIKADNGDRVVIRDGNLSKE